MSLGALLSSKGEACLDIPHAQFSEFAGGLKHAHQDRKRCRAHVCANRLVPPWDLKIGLKRSYGCRLLQISHTVFLLLRHF